MAAVAYENELPNPGVELSGNLSDVWNGGYFWRDIFVRHADNRILLRHVIDRLTKTSLQMAERRTALTDLTGYYAHITGDEIPQDQLQRLKDWVSVGYDLRKHTILSERELQSVRGREKALEEDDDIPIGLNPCAIIGKRKGPMVIASEVPNEKAARLGGR
ncbi:hypothetical protein [Paenibacillus odorifer]|uniref:Uncharacterized protein n=1 Tax=Paenibacillus odorifer TaxID=189426 RepID=A0A1R0XES4_9BACL|nr:hypothetical protein [Paenibacillus odorifer]OMD33565.1 hypothetical protein BJP51_12330 [Paenibacillus odorifer]